MKTAEDLCRAAKDFTDTGTWYYSWHWRRNNGYWNELSVEDALEDLRCGDMQQEIEAAIAHIKRRYALADEMKDYLERCWE